MKTVSSVGQTTNQKSEVTSLRASVPTSMTLEEKFQAVKAAWDNVWLSAGVGQREFTYYKIAES